MLDIYKGYDIYVRFMTKKAKVSFVIGLFPFYMLYIIFLANLINSGMEFHFPMFIFSLIGFIGLIFFLVGLVGRFALWEDRKWFEKK